MARGSRATSRSSWRLVVPLVFGVSGFLFVVSAISADGSDLRPAGDTVDSLLAERAARIGEDRIQARGLLREIRALSEQADTSSTKAERRRLGELQAATGLVPAIGPGLRVTLNDAPRGMEVPGLDPNALLVHQQDIQAFVNALWSGGAEAVTLQGQRLITTTGIKCVGSTVVLDGIPYAPPYVIEAVGNVDLLKAGLAASQEVQTYERYADRYELGLDVVSESKLTAPAYAGTISLRWATARN
ncbi:DUF881 domain-containing protein [soil metagenome]